MSYITIDLDWPRKYEIMVAWNRVEDCGYYPEGRVSASGHGIHIRSTKLPSYPIGVNESERRYCLDDPKRIAGDIDGDLAVNQVLWDEKDGNEAGEWTDWLDQLLRRYERSVTLTPIQYEAKYE
jgi:hypothetical protein